MPKPAAELISDDSWLPPDLLQETPPCLRRNERTRNLWFSRKKVADFIDGVLQTRSRQGASACSTPFAQHMLRGLKEEMGEGCTHEATEFGANVYAAVKRYSSEPDFLAYFLLLQGKLPDTAVRDSKAMCPELLRIFTSHFGSGDDGLNNITKQKFYHGLREFLQNKDEKMWKELVTYFPAGGPDVLVNFEWLLLDDLYVLSPVVFALRLQHLEEVLTLVERLEQVVHAAADARRKVKYEDIKAAFADDNELSFLHEEDYAKAFETSVAELTPGSEQDAGRFIDLVRAGDILRGLFFPILPSDDADAPAADVG